MHMREVERFRLSNLNPGELTAVAGHARKRKTVKLLVSSLTHSFLSNPPRLQSIKLRNLLHSSSGTQ